MGNPFKSSLFGKSAGYEAVQKKFVRSKSEIKDRKLADMTKRTVLSVLQGTYDRTNLYPNSKRRASTPYCATQRKGASMGLPSSTTARDAC